MVTALIILEPDPALVRHIAAKCARKPSSANEAAALLFSCGLTQDELLGQEVMAAAKSGELGTRSLHDVARAHAVVAVALTGAEGVTNDLLRACHHPRQRLSFIVAVRLRCHPFAADRLEITSLALGSR